MSIFFPEIEPYRAGDLPVADGHVLYWEASGRKDGLPLLFLHGGPGSGSHPKYRRLFDPLRYNIILFDQRGAGRSTPHLGLEANTTQDLIDDIETLRHTLGIERWIVFGPSWGSTLALAYAEAFPEHVSALIVEAVFLGTQEELDWWHHPLGAPRFFPEAWADFIAPIPERFRTSPNEIARYCLDEMQKEAEQHFVALNRLTDPNVSLGELRKSTLYRWTEYEERLSYLEKTADAARADLATRGPAFVAAHSMIEAHYFLNRCFLEPGQLIAGARQLANTPMQILHSRYDMVCPPQSAFRLAEACPHAHLRILTLGGHGLTEPMQAMLNDAMDEVWQALAGHTG